jgi:prolyl-tRNA editing enzyme YbaK/EbsC (Cys-tRNA(Pro) deacylase)
MHVNALRIQAVLDQAGCQAVVREMAESTRTAAEAAAACGCGVGQIVKSLIFRVQPGDEIVLLLVSGSNRVDEKKVGRKLGSKLERASAEEVQRATGFAIGGVPPLGHPTRLRTWIDVDLMQYDVVWAAAGTPRAVFPIAPQELQSLTGAEAIDLRQE